MVGAVTRSQSSQASPTNITSEATYPPSPETTSVQTASAQGSQEPPESTHTHQINENPFEALKEQQRRLEGNLLQIQTEVSENIPGNMSTTPVNLKLPPFWKANPAIWFGLIENSFQLNGITDDTIQYRHVLLHLDNDTLPAVSDLLSTPPAESKYVTIKNRILTMYAETAETKLRRLLRGIEFTNEKPSMILQQIKNQAGGQLNDPALRTLFFEHLPEHVRAILAINEDQDLTKVAAQADKIVEVANNFATPTTSFNTNSQVMAASHQDLAKPKAKEKQSMQDQIDKLSAQMKEIASTLNKLVQQNGNRSRSRSKSRARIPANSPTCYYHQKFGDNARRCQAPCDFKTKNSPSTSQAEN
ncbi:uncharacterized protein [Venturia canescens]|uniref:uncharacterized protein n=1 Tax=Venturia canescens TaxID=32260 RepID=UPI001C9C9517|nr:uncharacterized protein LOC122413194 [Venturia canescens]